MATPPEDVFIQLLRDAQIWNEHGKDYIPIFACSSCGKGCLPLCGVGVDKTIRPVESKDLVFQTRKTMLEVGKPAAPILMQIVTGTGVNFFCGHKAQAINAIRANALPPMMIPACHDDGGVGAGGAFFFMRAPD